MKANLILLLCLLTNMGFGQITFQKTYGDTDLDQGRCVIQTADGGYALCGWTASFGVADGAWDGYVIKTDMYGDTLWTRTFGGPGFDFLREIVQTTDGGYVLTGDVHNVAATTDVSIIKLDSLGDTLWTRQYGGAGYDAGSSIRQTSDGGYIVSGQTNSFGAGSDDIYLLKTDANGDTLWTKTIGGTGPEYGYCVQQANDGGYIIVGSTGLFSADSGNVFLVKTDTAGNVSWAKSYGGNGNSIGYSVQQTTDGGYILGGIVGFLTPDSSDIYLIKTDATGDTLWTRTYGGMNDDFGFAVQQTSDGGYIVADRTNSFGAGGSDVYLVKTDGSGNIQWTKAIGGVNNDYCASVRQTTDGGYVIAGVTYSFGRGNGDFYLIKTDSNGDVGCYEMNAATAVKSKSILVTDSFPVVTSPPAVRASNVIYEGWGAIVNTLCTTVDASPVSGAQFNSISIYPNPVPASSSSYSITICYPATAGKREIIVNDVHGRVAGRYDVPSNSDRMEVKLHELAKGIYVARLVGDGESAFAKFVVE